MKTSALSRTVGLVTSLLLFWATSAVAETSKEYAVRGKRAWTAFECCSLASAAGEKDRPERLFAIGLSDGRAFIEALKEKKIKQEDLNSEVPLAMLLLLQGPSTDFMLGRVFEGAQENALKTIYRSDGHPYSDEEKKRLAELELSKRNCDSITK